MTGRVEPVRRWWRWHNLDFWFVLTLLGGAGFVFWFWLATVPAIKAMKDHDLLVLITVLDIINLFPSYSRK